MSVVFAILIVNPIASFWDMVDFNSGVKRSLNHLFNVSLVQLNLEFKNLSLDFKI